MGIHLLEYHELSKPQTEKANDYFQQVVYPVLTPLALDPGIPFPHISNLSLNLAIVIRDKKGHEKFARLKVPDTLPRLVPIKRSSGAVRKDGTIPHHHYFVWLEQVIMANLATLSQVWKWWRPIRSASFVMQMLRSRRSKRMTCWKPCSKASGGGSLRSVVQVEIYQDMPDPIRELLIENLEIRQNDVYILPAPLGLSSLWQIYNNVETA